MVKGGATSNVKDSYDTFVDLLFGPRHSALFSPREVFDFLDRVLNGGDMEAAAVDYDPIVRALLARHRDEEEQEETLKPGPPGNTPKHTPVLLSLPDDVHDESHSSGALSSSTFL